MRGLVQETKDKKQFRSEEYNFNLDKKTGEFERWGKTLEDDPDFSPFGPEILDLEISTSVRPEDVDKYNLERLVYDEGCLGQCHFCSPAGTKVNTHEGLVNIEDINIGDYVLSSKVSGNKVNGYSKNVVQELYKRHYEGEMITVAIEDGTTLQLTPNHPVFVKNKGWVNAGDLQEGDDLKTLVEYNNEFCRCCGDRVVNGQGIKRHYCSQTCYDKKHEKIYCKLCGDEFNPALNKHFCIPCLITMGIDNNHYLAKTYRDMMYRCYVSSRINYKDYGGAGIKVCKEWLNFDAFLLDVGERPSEDQTLDRVDPSGDYTSSNVVWAGINLQRGNRGKFSDTINNYKGVLKLPSGNYTATCKKDKEEYYLGTYPSEILAAKAYNKKIKELYPNRYEYIINKIVEGKNEDN